MYIITFISMVFGICYLLRNFVKETLYLVIIDIIKNANIEFLIVVMVFSIRRSNIVLISKGFDDYANTTSSTYLGLESTLKDSNIEDIK